MKEVNCVGWHIVILTSFDIVLVYFYCWAKGGLYFGLADILAQINQTQYFKKLTPTPKIIEHTQQAWITSIHFRGIKQNACQTDHFVNTIYYYFQVLSVLQYG